MMTKAKTVEEKVVTCDCGCGGAMSPGAIERGHKFLRGHKPQGALITKSKKLGHTRTLRLQSSSTSAPLMATYAREQAKTINAQIDDALKLIALVDDLRAKAAEWERIADSIDALTK